MAATKEPWVPPEDPNFHTLCTEAYAAWWRDKPELIAFDTETSGVQFFDEPFCVTLAWRSKDGRIEEHYLETERLPLGKETASIILNATPRWVGHNIKFDLQKCILAGIIKREDVTPERIEDTEALAHLDNEHRLKGLKKLAITVLHEEDVVEVETMSGPYKGKIRQVPREKWELDKARRQLKRKQEEGYHVLPRGLIVPYAIKDASLTLRLYEALHPRVHKYADLASLYRQEMELTLVLLDMEAQGLGVDKDYAKSQFKFLTKEVFNTELEMETVLGREIGKAKTQFNPNSNPQIAQFFTENGYPSDKYDREVLEDIPHPLASLILCLRKALKLRDTYFRAMLEGMRFGVFHPSIRQHGTVTGRTSSGKETG